MVENINVYFGICFLQVFIQQFVDKIVGYFVFGVVVLFILIVIVWIIVGYSDIIKVKLDFVVSICIFFVNIFIYFLFKNEVFGQV